MSAYTRQKAKSKYTNRIRLERASQEQSSDTHKTPYDRVKRCRERKKMKASERVNDGASTSAAGAAEPMQVDDVIASVSTKYYPLTYTYSRKIHGRFPDTATPRIFLG
jgi:hypothetical protein